MSRSYDDKKRLAYIECDSCDAKIRPAPDIADSGWMKTGTVSVAHGVEFERDWCPDCWRKRPQDVFAEAD